MTVSYNGINFLIPNAGEAAHWNYLSRGFLNLFTEFLKKLRVIEVYVTWIWNNRTGSLHNSGMALDIHYVKYSSGYIQYFTRRMKEYSRSGDDSFYSKAAEQFRGKYNFEYISPANIETSYHFGFNRYRYALQSAAENLINSSGYEINKSHLDHLHFGIDPNPANRPKKIHSRLLMSAAVFSLFSYGIYRGLKWKKII